MLTYEFGENCKTHSFHLKLWLHFTVTIYAKNHLRFPLIFVRHFVPDKNKYRHDPLSYLDHGKVDPKWGTRKMTKESLSKPEKV